MTTTENILNIENKAKCFKNMNSTHYVNRTKTPGYLLSVIGDPHNYNKYNM